jgi:hypothetical protein
LITPEKNKIFDRFKGDYDSFVRMGMPFENKLFENNDWALIDNVYQDIKLINNTPVAESYIEQVIINLKEVSDRNAFDILTNQIDFYNDFQKVAGILNLWKNFHKPFYTPPFFCYR